MSKAADLANLIGNINAGGGGANKNAIINGDFKVKQRAGTGTQSTGLGNSDGYHLHDRWYLDTGASTDGRLTMSHDSSAPSGFANSMKLACTTTDTSIASGEQLLIQQRIEGQNLQAFAKGTSDAKPFAVSFYVKGNASATYICELHDKDNDRQCSKTFNVTTDWTRIELTFPADTTGAFDDDTSASLHLNIALHAGATYTSGTLNSSAFATTNNNNRYVGTSSFFDSTDRTFFITGVQLEVGQNPTEFEHEPFERTLAKCRRYYHKIDSSDSVYQRFCQGQAFQNDDATMFVHLHPEMRGIPTLDYGTLSNLAVGLSGFSARSIGTLALDSNTDGTNTCTLNVGDVDGDGLSAGDVVQLFSNNNTNGYIAFKAEL
jgi:hypothetical protein